MFIEEKDITKLRRVNSAKHTITLQPGKKLLFRLLYNLLGLELKVLREYLD